MRTNRQTRFFDAIEALVARSDAIAALAVDGDRPLSAAFSKKENICTADISIAFMEAVAATSSIEDIRVLKPEIERLRDHVMASTETVSDRICDNPLVLSGFVNGLQTLFRLMLEADPTIRVVAGFASEHKGVVRSVFMAFLTDIRHQLESSEGVRPNRLAQGAESLVNGLGTLLSRRMTSTLEQYAETTRKEMRSTKKELLRAYQSGGESVETLSGPRSEEKRPREFFGAFVQMKKFVRQAKKDLVVIDPYFDETCLPLIAQKRPDVTVTVVRSAQPRLANKLHAADIAQFNTQYGGLTEKRTDKFHDRYLIFDNATLIPVGASLNRLGRRCFAFSTLDAVFIPDIMARVP